MEEDATIGFDSAIFDSMSFESVSNFVSSSIFLSDDDDEDDDDDDDADDSGARDGAFDGEGDGDGDGDTDIAGEWSTFVVMNIG